MFNWVRVVRVREKCEDRLGSVVGMGQNTKI